MASEVDRYLGWPGQAISYKVGERVWLEAAGRRPGAATAPPSTSRRSTPTRSTSGPLGLDLLVDQLDLALQRPVRERSVGSLPVAGRG